MKKIFKIMSLSKNSDSQILKVSLLVLLVLIIGSFVIIVFRGNIFNREIEELNKSDTQVHKDLRIAFKTSKGTGTQIRSKVEEKKLQKTKPAKEETKDEQSEEYFLVQEVESNLNQVVDCQYRVRGVSSPKGVAFRPETDEFWVTSLMNKKYGAVVFNENSGKRLKEITLPDGGGVEIIFNNSGSKAYVSQMETGRVFEINAETKEISNTYNAGSSWTKALTFSKDKKDLYASNWVGNDVSKINLTSNELIDKIPTVNTPRGIYVADHFLYVAGFENGQIQKVDLKTGEAEVLIETGGSMRSIAGGEDYIYVSDMGLGAIYRINKQTDKVEEFAETDNNPNTIKLTKNNQILVVSNRGINNPESYHKPGPEWGSILFFNTEDGELLDVLIGGNQPTALDVNSKGTKMVYSNFLDGDLVVCELPVYEEFLKVEDDKFENYRKHLKK